MLTSSFLDFQYNLSKRKLLTKPSRMFSRDRQNSGLFPIYLPNIDELKQIFNIFDSNRDGKISPDEYKFILKAIGEGDLHPREIKKIFKVADLDRDGFIDFNEFVEVQKEGGGVKTAELHGAFKAFDKDGDGKITATDVHEMLTKIGERCSLQDCQRMVRAIDSNGDGVIDLDEFIAMMTRNMTIIR